VLGSEMVEPPSSGPSVSGAEPSDIAHKIKTHRVKAVCDGKLFHVHRSADASEHIRHDYLT
jgi:hypothetical protein